MTSWALTAMLLIGVGTFCIPSTSCNQLGCFNDDSNDRALEVDLFTNGQQTVTRCVAQCQQRNHTYAGLEYGNRCYCGDRHDYSRHGIRALSDCETPCAGNASQQCGGNLRIAVYTVCAPGEFSDGAGACGSLCYCDADHVCRYHDGQCPAGCQPGWTGLSCNKLDCNHANGGCEQICDSALNKCFCHDNYLVDPNDESLCIDIDECDTVKRSVCHECVNTPGSYYCECDSGYRTTENGTVCEDENECAGEGAGVDESCHNCTNTPGSHLCGCREGYRPDSTNKTCLDYDECRGEGGGIDASCHRCINTPGSHLCQCNQGYTAVTNQTRCVDIDECHGEGEGIDKSCHTCNNTIGSYFCTCDAGFNLTVDAQGCVDVDECQGEGGGRHPSCHQCTNTQGSHVCQCRHGYKAVNDRKQCADVDECIEGIADASCHNCTNTEGSYSCSCSEGFNLTDNGLACDSLIEIPPSSTPIVSIAVGVVVSAVVVIVVMVAGYIIYRRRKKWLDDREPTDLSMIGEATLDTDSSVVITDIEVRATRMIHAALRGADDAPHDIDRQSLASCDVINDGNEEPLDRPQVDLAVVMPDDSLSQPQSHLIPTLQLLEYVAEKKANRHLFYEIYKAIPEVMGTCTYALQPEVKIKNRYKNVVPYDANRVILKQLGDNPHSTYFNGSFIRGYNNETFIASHGPNKTSLPDFWRMMWEQDVHLIVMLTNEYEDTKKKCESYWGEADGTAYGNINVILSHQQQWPDFTMRMLTCSQGDDQRTVVQYQFTSWPDHGVPQQAAAILRLRRKVREAMSGSHPVVVHCSAGVGRTGTFLALDWLLEQAQHEEGVDIVGCVYQLRQSRMQMVQGVEQFEFIHAALVEALAAGDTAITIKAFQEMYSHRQKRRSVVGLPFIATQCKILEEMATRQSDKDRLTMAKPENLLKNRNTVYPRARYHVKIRGALTGASPYINAVYVPSYSSRTGYIATHWPLPDTLVDFWSMVFETKCTQIVVLEDKTSQEGFPALLASQGDSLMYGNRTITVDSEERHELFTSYDVIIHKADTEKTNSDFVVYYDSKDADAHVTLYEMTSLTAMLNVDAMHEINRDMAHHPAEKCTTVVCSDGYSLCGLYIACSILTRMAEAEQEVDMFYVTQQIQQSCPEFISQAQYRELHEIMREVCSSLTSSP